MSKTVKIESVPRAEQIALTQLGRKTYAEPVVAVVHKTGAMFTVWTAEQVVELKSGEVTYSRDLPAKGVATCTTAGHGPKAQRPGGIFFCRTCYRDQQKAYRARKSGKALPVKEQKATERQERLERVLKIVQQSPEYYAECVVRNIARMTSLSDAAKEARLIAAGIELHLTPERVAEIVRAS